MMRKFAVAPVLLAAAGLLSGCGSSEKPAETVSIIQTYKLVDDQGRVAGRVTLSPLGAGQIIDSTGQVIGKIVPPNTQVPAQSY